MPSASYFVEDICNLTELNDACVLEVTRSRYLAQLIHVPFIHSIHSVKSKITF